MNRCAFTARWIHQSDDNDDHSPKWVCVAERCIRRGTKAGNVRNGPFCSSHSFPSLTGSWRSSVAVQGKDEGNRQSVQLVAAAKSFLYLKRQTCFTSLRIESNGATLSSSFCCRFITATGNHQNRNQDKRICLCTRHSSRAPS